MADWIVGHEPSRKSWRSLWVYYCIREIILRYYSTLKFLRLKWTLTNLGLALCERCQVSRTRFRLCTRCSTRKEKRSKEKFARKPFPTSARDHVISNNELIPMTPGYGKPKNREGAKNRTPILKLTVLINP
jgi:hypothetical protein